MLRGTVRDKAQVNRSSKVELQLCCTAIPSRPGGLTTLCLSTWTKCQLPLKFPEPEPRLALICSLAAWDRS
jgi:hypothetical protein